MAANSKRKLVQRILILKYAILILLLSFFSYWVYSKFPNNFSLENFVLGLFYSVIGAILLSLFYDLFTKSEAKLNQLEEMDEMKLTLSNNFLSYIDLNSMPVASSKKLAETIYLNDNFMMTISELMAKGSGRDLFNTLIKPLRDGRLLKDVYVENTLRSNTNENSYTLEFKQRFKAPDEMNEFFVVYCCDNDIYNKMFYSKSCIIDSAIGSSPSEWNKIEESIATMHFKGEQIINGRKENFDIIPIVIDGDDLMLRIPIDGIDLTNTRAFSFQLPDNHQDTEFEFYYEVENSLSDPYYYWIAENPMYLNEVILNYENVKNKVGRVSANCIMGNQIYEPVHNERRGIFTVKTRSLVWPGHGAMIIWRPNNSESSTAHVN